jgi:ribosomal protein S18 acetylase RimI-like enzyme
MSEKISTIELARCYSTVFRGKPWEEAFLDASGQFLSLESGMESWKRKVVQRAYPLIPTAQYIQAETGKPDSILITQTDAPNKPRRVIAFSWGYGVASTTALVTEKWEQADPVDQEALNAIMSKACDGNKPWYLSEVGVLPELQGKRLGSFIVAKLVAEASRLPIIMRTNQESPMTRIANNNGFEPIVGLDTGIIDPVNPQRVLYVRRPR